MNSSEEQIRSQLIDAELTAQELRLCVESLRSKLSASEAREAHAKETMAGVALKYADALQKIAELEARAGKAEALWHPFETAPKTTATQVVYIIITDGVCLPDIVTWKPARPEYIDAFGTKYLERPEGWFRVDGARSRLCGKATHWTHIPKQPARAALKEQANG